MAKTVDQFGTIEDFRKKYNELAVDVGDKSGLRTTDSSTIVDALNSLEDKSFFFQEFVYTATASQTVFGGADTQGNTLKVRKDRLQVFKNGSHQIEGTDYTVTGGDSKGNFTNVVLTSGASAGNVIVVYGFTGSYLGVAEGSSGGGGHFTETAAKTIFNTNDEGVILNGNGSPDQTTALQSGFTIQLAGKTYVEDDMTFVANKSVTTSGSGRFIGDLNGNADTVTNGVYLSATQTLTNKTLTSPVVGGDVTTSSGNLSLNSATSIVEVKGDGSSVEGQIRLNCHANSHGQTIKPQPHSSNVTNTMLLPQGANSTLVSRLSIDTLENKTLTSPTITGTGAIAGTFTGNLTGNASGQAGTVASITSHSLQNLGNVTASASPSAGQVLSWTGTAWSNTNPAATFTQADARSAISGGPGLDYNSGTGEMKANTSNGIEINSDSIELDYETVNSAPAGVGSTATGHLWFVI
jgi:hypothetical protein